MSTQDLNLNTKPELDDIERKKRLSIIRQYYQHRVHFGHHPNQLNPKMTPYLYKGKLVKQNYDKKGYHLINISLTSYLLNKAKFILETLKSEKAELNTEEVILFVGTKFQLKSVVAQEAIRCNQYYVNYRWLGGMLTNWNTLKDQINKLKSLELQSENGTFDALPIKEANKRIKELKSLQKCLIGIKDMPRLPDIVIITHQRQDLIAVQECKKLGIPIIGVVDTDCDPDLIDYVIPANDDSTVSVKYILNRLGNSIIGEVEMEPDLEKN